MTVLGHHESADIAVYLDLDTQNDCYGHSSDTSDDELNKLNAG